MKVIKLEILNIGPIKDIKLNLNKVNIFIGAQSSGKSTIAKILSFCNWVEKDIAIHQSFEKYSINDNYFIEKLEAFHKMKGYFSEKSEIIYESNTIKFHHKINKFNISWVDKFAYKRSKISYIPSERSVAILPELEKVELPNNYLKSFLFDWFDARKGYHKEKSLSILDLNTKYYFSESSKENHINSENEKYDILLSQASSGLQSLTPLAVMIDYLINNIYSDEQNLSYELDEVKTNVTQLLISELIIQPLQKIGKLEEKDRKEIIKELRDRIAENDEIVLNLFNKFSNIRENLFKTNSTNLIIEEPEQNLFPSTQKTLIYYLLKSINNNPEHCLTLTTHSPYVLYALNNSIMASIVNKKLSNKEKKEIQCFNSKISPENISIYQIKGGVVNLIQQEDGLIKDNYFDNQMKEVMDDFYKMLNHY